MRRLAALTGALTRDWLRSREAVFFTLLFPIVLLVIFSAVFATGAPEFTLFVQNNDVDENGEPTELSETFVEALDSTDAVTVERVDPATNRSEWAQGGESTETKRLVVIPEGFNETVRQQSVRVRAAVIEDTINRSQGDLTDNETANARNGLQQLEGSGDGDNATGPATVTLYTTPDDQSSAVLRGILTSVVSGFNEEAIGVDEPPVTVETATLGDEGLGAADYFLPAFIAAVVAINGLMTLPSVIAGFKHDGTLKRLVATPLRKREWILAHVIQQAGLAIAITFVMVLVARLVYGVTAIPGPLSLGLVALSAVGFGAIGMVLGSVLDTPDAATSLGGAVAFPMMFLSGVFWELDVMPPWLQAVGEVMPLFHLHRGLRQLMIVGSTEGVLTAYLAQIALVAVFVPIAVRVTRWRDLE